MYKSEMAIPMQKNFSYAGAVVKLTINENNFVKRVEFERGVRSAPEVSYAELLKYKIDFSTFSVFEKAVLKKTREIPAGKVATYGEVALAACRRRAARAVGRVMAKNPFPVVVPCHRVIKSDLTPGGYSGGRAKLKRRLLESEGVGFNEDKVRPEFVYRF